MVGLFSINRAEWVIAEYACHYQSLVTVPLYDTLGAEAIEFIITQTELSIIYTTADKLKNLLAVASKLPSLKRIVLMDGVTDAIVAQGRAANLEILAMSDVEKVKQQQTRAHASAIPLKGSRAREGLWTQSTLVRAPLASIVH